MHFLSKYPLANLEIAKFRVRHLLLTIGRGDARYTPGMSAGKSRGYELHHPMSWRDAIAALFRGRPRPTPPDHIAETALGLSENPDVEKLYPTVTQQAPSEACTHHEASPQIGG